MGIIGCGAIGTLIAESVEKGIVKCDRLVLYDSRIELANLMAKRMHLPTTVANSVDGMIRLKPDIIVEAASQQAVRDYARKILGSNIELIVMSVGALLSLDLPMKKLHYSSGAIGGIDAIESAALVGINEVFLVTRKSPKILDLSNREERIVFEGSAEEAVQRFPKELNVAALLALTVKPVKVSVEVVSDPNVKDNVHEIHIAWRYGTMDFRFCNEPHPDNPKTSALAAWSAVKLLGDVLGSV